jgi:lipopolysaccharide heptosyltransferase II
VSEKILVVTKNWLGDVVFESAALKTLKKNFPDSELVCAAPERCRPVLENYPYVDRVLSFDEKGRERSLFERWARVGEWRRECFTHAFIFHRSFSRALGAWLAWIPYRAGYRTKHRGLLLNHGVPEPPPGFHDADYYLHLLKQLGFKADLGVPYEFYFTPAEEGAVFRLLACQGLASKNYFVFHTGANWEPKRWSGENFLRLAGLLQKEVPISILLTGAKPDVPRIEELIRRGELLGLKICSLAGETTLGELGALFFHARAVVSNDSGPLHIAAGVGAKTVALFGPTNAVKTGPRGRGESILIKKDKMSDIQPEEVLEALRRLGVLTSQKAEVRK